MGYLSGYPFLLLFAIFIKMLRFNLRLQVETQLFIEKRQVKINILYTIADLLLYIQTLV